MIDQGENRSFVNRNAQIITDALSGVGLLDQLLRDPYVEEIFVRDGEVAVEYDGSFYHLGKPADDSYFENLLCMLLIKAALLYAEIARLLIDSRRRTVYRHVPRRN